MAMLSGHHCLVVHCIVLHRLEEGLKGDPADVGLPQKEQRDEQELPFGGSHNNGLTITKELEKCG